MSDQGTEAPNSTLRSSQRDRRAPEFFGDPVSHLKPRTYSARSKEGNYSANYTQMDTTASAIVPKTRSYHGTVAPSVKSIRNNTALRKAEVDAVTADKVAALNKVHRDKLQACEQIKKKAEDIRTYIKRCQENLDHENCPPENRKQYLQWIPEKQEELLNLQCEINSMEIAVKYAQQELDEATAVLLTKANVEKQRIQNEEDDELEDLSNGDRRSIVADFVNQSLSQNQLGDLGEGEGSLSNRVLTKKLEEVPSHTTIQPQNPSTNAFDNVAHTFKSALEHIIATIPTGRTNSSSTDKLLARQIHGRDLPSFEGNPEEWATFISTYEASTANCKFTNTENLVRLQKCLKGEAKQTVQSLLVSEANVPAVIDKLRTWFGRPDLIINAMLNKARSTSAVKSDKPETLVELGRTIDSLVATVLSLKQGDQLSNPVLVKELSEKLPQDLQLQWSLHITKNAIMFPKLDDFASWFEPYTQASRLLCTAPAPVHTEKNDHSTGNRRRRNERSMMTNEKPNNKQSNGSKPKCFLCSGGDHRPRECPTFRSKNVDERYNIVKEKRACFGCLNKGHSFQDCKSKRPCGIDGCSKLHSRLLHSSKLKSTESGNNQEKPKEQVKVTQESSSQEEKPTVLKINETCFKTQAESINFSVVPAFARKADGTLLPLFIAFDNFSSLTAISAETARQLGLSGTKQPFTVEGFQATTTVQNSEVVNIDIVSSTSDFQYTLKNVKTVPKLQLPTQTLSAELLQHYEHLRGLDLEPYDNVTPTILLGIDHSDLHIPLRVKRGRPGEPHAVKTVLGWSVMGKSAKRMQGNNYHSFKITEIHEDPLHAMVKHFFTTEAVGGESTTHKPRSTEDTRAQAIMDATIKRVSNGWESGLLWKEDDIDLPDSEEYALKRLMSMERKMDRDPDFAKQYEERIQEYLQKGFARVLTPEEASIKSKNTFYLPHFMTVNEKKPNKFRHVFDAAAKVKGRSLNDHLLQGPDKMKSLVGILLQFRQRAIAVTADIKDFFHRVKVRKEDSSALRFLWRGTQRDIQPQTLEMGVLIFGAACSPTCAQEAKDKNALEFKDEFPKACESILNQLYVDDLLDCCDTEEEAIQMQKDVTEVLRRGSFNLCNWLSNSKKVMNSIPEELKSKSLKSIGSNEDFIERVLGMFWRPESDDFTFQLKYLKAKKEILDGEKIPTKTEVLSLVMSIYDPLGVINLLIVKAKMILQACWRAKIGWDDEIPRSTFDQWKQWLSELRNIETFRIPRCYSLNFSTAESVQLHIFCDGGEEAYGAVAYFRIRKGDQIDTSLIMAKSNVAPLKPLSIPRLELQAALTASRVAELIRGKIQLPIHRTVFWSDSELVLGWIRADGRKYQQFVAARIGTIQVMTNVAQWRWVPTKENVADELTRFAKPCDWSPTSRWINGPAFLKEDEANWPKQKNFEEPELESKPTQVYLTHEIKPFMDPSAISSWWKLVRVTAYVRRFINNSRTKTKEIGSLSFKEIINAKSHILKIMQADSFPEELESLKKGEQIKKSSKLRKASPMLQNGIMLVKGRLDNASCLPEITKRPIIMDSKHPYSRLILDHFHNVCGHHGQERIANELRQEYYVVGLRSAVKGAQSRCQLCKNNKANPIPPEMGQLPKFRLDNQVRAFLQTGLDYFGPIEVVVKRSREKRYVALFTCLATRAIHLELANSLSTDSCIMALRRFVSRRGNPISIYSDNGTNFLGAKAELKKALEELDQDKLQWMCTTKGIQWHFNPPSAPHMGGSWERMVRSVKIALGDTLQMKNLREEVLLTLLAEAEFTVNCHPLTYVSMDPNDEEALTPNHFLIGPSCQDSAMGEFNKDDMFGRKQWRTAQEMANHFWRRWVKEYLPTLLRREKWCATTKPIQVGDVVIEVNANLPRNCWPKGRVVKLFPGQDGVIRVVDIMLSNRHVYRRPVAKLCILDVQNPNQETTAQDNI